MATITVEIQGMPVKIEGTPHEVLAISTELILRHTDERQSETSANTPQFTTIKRTLRSSALPVGRLDEIGEGSDQSHAVVPRSPDSSAEELAIDRYMDTLLDILAEMNGEGNANQVTQLMFNRLESEFTQGDRAKSSNGVEKWKKRVKWARERLVRNGLLAKDSGRGVWRLSPERQAEIANRTDDGSRSQ